MRSQSKELRSVKVKSFLMDTVGTVLGDRGKPPKWHSSPLLPSKGSRYPGFINLFNSWYYFVIESKERENLGISVGVCLISWFESESHSVVSDSLQPHGLYSPWNFLCKNTGVGSLSLLQRIFLTQESNWGLRHYRRIVYQLSYQGSLFDFLLLLFTFIYFPYCPREILRKCGPAWNYDWVGFQELAGLWENPS